MTDQERLKVFDDLMANDMSEELPTQKEMDIAERATKQIVELKQKNEALEATLATMTQFPPANLTDE